MLHVLTKHEAHTIDISQAKLTNAIRLVGRLVGNVGASLDDLFIVGIHVLHPLKQVKAVGTSIARYMLRS